MDLELSLTSLKTSKNASWRTTITSWVQKETDLISLSSAAKFFPRLKTTLTVVATVVATGDLAATTEEEMGVTVATEAVAAEAAMMEGAEEAMAAALEAAMAAVATTTGATETVTTTVAAVAPEVDMAITMAAMDVNKEKTTAAEAAMMVEATGGAKTKTVASVDPAGAAVATSVTTTKAAASAEATVEAIPPNLLPATVEAQLQATHRSARSEQTQTSQALSMWPTSSQTCLTMISPSSSPVRTSM